ncbi:MAG: TonB-dependent hemoglobin/transferrin/lactoferrin family receptor [Acidobacteria bacterium]|nr:TonB-dependent hemoglobin/transferrin/lactoferrin family receptor [Acidobacteriota bacterium]
MTSRRLSQPAWIAIPAAALVLALAAPVNTWAQGSQAPAATTAAEQPPADPPQEQEPQPARFFDSVTVSATLSPTVVRDTPGTVSVIGAETIQRRMIESTADLVKFEPGVYIDANVTRVGLNGFNIRGIGGNRVMTRVDGVETSEQFDFGPFNVHQFSLDLDTLKTAEIVRSSASSLYGSDALGGVVSFFTKDPADYLNGQSRHIGGKLLFDGRAEDTSGNAVLAGGNNRVQASLFGSYANGHEMRNRGRITAENATRTAPNPQDRTNIQALGKVTVRLGDGNTLRGAVEVADNDVTTEAFFSRTVTAAGPTVTSVTDIDSVDTMRRQRYSIDQTIDNRLRMNHLSWSLYAQNSDTDQVVDEVRVMTGPTSLTVLRNGTLEYEQQTIGGTAQGRKLVTPGGQGVLLTFGGSYKRDVFDMIRDRVDHNAATGAIVPAVNTILPSKYFPKSTVGEGGAYLQAEAQFGRVTVLPGLRYDRFTLDGDEADQVYIDNQNPRAADFSADRVSTRVGASLRLTNALSAHVQYSGGFRAPPYSAVNSGFTNLAGGYTSLPNTDLRPETSDNFEGSLRAATGRVSFGATVFSNHYDDFILQAFRGINPGTGLMEYQYQNVSKVSMNGLELQGDARLARDLRLRAAYTIIRGNDVSTDVDVPINTVAPDQGTLGLQYDVPSGRWGSELIVRAVRGQRPDVAGTGFYAPAAFAVADATGWLRVAPDLIVRVGVLNFTNTRYFEWSNVRGRQASDINIDRYSSPGAAALLSLSYGW